MITVSANERKPRELVPAGSHTARCFKMIHIGTVEDMYEGKPRVQNKVRITFEVLDEFRVFKEEDGEQPMLIDKEYTVSFHENANLRRDLENWRGKGFSPEELEGFDITKLIGAYAMISITHMKTKKGVPYAGITSISGLPKGLAKPKPVSDNFIFDYNENFSTEAVEEFPDFIKDKIKASREYEERINQLEGKEEEKKQAVVKEEAEEELPF